MTYLVLNRDIIVRKRVFWTIGEHLYFVYCPIISYQRIKVYRVETIDMGRFRWKNVVIGKSTLVSTVALIYGVRTFW